MFIDRFKKYKQAGSHSNSFRLTNGRSDDTGKTSYVLIFSLHVSVDVSVHVFSCLIISTWWNL